MAPSTSLLRAITSARVSPVICHFQLMLVLTSCLDRAESIRPPAKVVIRSPAPDVREAKIATVEAQLVPDTHAGSPQLGFTTKFKPDAQAIARVHRYDCRFGTVELTSSLGRIFAGGHAIDFAMISLDPARFPEGFRPPFNVRSYDPPLDLVANKQLGSMRVGLSVLGQLWPQQRKS